jgi:hypothetical protein
MNLAGLEEYLFTAGLTLAFVATIASIAIGRRHFAAALRESGLNARKLAIAIGILAIFVFAEAAFVVPTQQLFFDDAIYQAGALDLLHTGQAWMCNYGSPSLCYSGQIYHEPIGTSFNIAIAFAIGGINSGAAYNAEFFLGGVAVFMTFLVALVMTGDFTASAFAELLMALSPALLTWARPTTSDMPMLAYSLVALFCVLVFMKKKKTITLSAAVFSLAVLTYMKVDALAYIIVIPAMFLVLDESSMGKSLALNFKRLKDHLMDTEFLVILLLLVLAVSPEAVYTVHELVSGSYGYQGAYLQNSCVSPGSANSTIVANGKIGIQEFDANICSNLEFWADAFDKEYIVQPLAFTALGILGAALMAVYDRRLLLAIGGWFLVFFLIYTSFYAGSVTYGVDWRFMLSLIAQASIFGGYGASKVIETIREGNHGQ